MSAEPSGSLIDPVAFGAQLSARRRALGLAQDKLAERIGISRIQLQNLEYGWSDRSKRSPANPTLSTLIGVCRELGGRLTIDLAIPTGVRIEFDAIPGE